MTTLLVGGFGLPPRVLSPLARDLRARVVSTGLTTGCGEVEVRKVLGAVDAQREPVTLIGHSRGGQLARVAAVRRPEAVKQLVTIGTPTSIGPPDRWGVPIVAAFLRRLPIDLALDCATADCCARFRADLATPVAARWMAVWSPIDRVVPASEARHPDADERVEVRASHIGLVVSAPARGAIVDAIEAAGT